MTPGNQHTVWDESVQSSSEAADGDHQFLRIVTVSQSVSGLLSDGDDVVPPLPPPAMAILDGRLPSRRKFYGFLAEKKLN